MPKLRLLAFCRKAVQEAWELEAARVAIGHKGSTHDWSRAERDELMANKKVERYYPNDIHGIDAYPGLADDPTNIAFRKESARKRRAKFRRRKEQKDREQKNNNKESSKDGKNKVNKDNNNDSNSNKDIKEHK